MAEKGRLIGGLGNAISQALMAGGQALTGQPFYTNYQNNQTALKNLEAEQRYKQWLIENEMAGRGYAPASPNVTPDDIRGMSIDQINALMPQQGMLQGQGMPIRPNVISLGGQSYAPNAQLLNNLRALKPNLYDGGVEDTAKSIADAIANGDQPPDMKGLYRYGGKVRGELAKRGFDMTKAQRDWLAVNKTINGLNSTQQVRMRQALDSVEKSIPALSDLSNQLSRSGLKVVNWAAINGALQGVGTQRDLATKYIGQINLMKDELAQGFMGGGVPTDRAFKLADDILQPLYGKDQMDASLKQLNYNLKIRKTAIQGITPLGIGGEVDNPKLTGAQVTQPSKYTKTGTNKKGQRVGMLPDGTIEVIK